MHDFNHKNNTNKNNDDDELVASNGLLNDYF
jgi:hypothetical protein